MATAKKTVPQKSGDIEVNKYIAAMSYVSFLFVIPLFLKRDSKFAQFHAKQGLLLFVAEVVLTVVGVVPLLGWLVAFFGWILAFAFALIGILKSLSGEYWKMPILGDHVNKINL